MHLTKTSLGWQLHLSDQEVDDLLDEVYDWRGQDIGLDAFHKAVKNSIYPYPKED